LLKNEETLNLLGAAVLAFPGIALEDWQVALAIASVVEAIDQHQYENHRDRRDTPFSGVFALATTTTVGWAKEAVLGDDSQSDATVSRPRRCWVLPLTLSALDVHKRNLERIGEERIYDAEMAELSHTFLALVQEETHRPTAKDRRISEFIIGTLDPSPHIFQQKPDARACIGKVTRTIASNLQWTKQRNIASGTTNHVSFAPGLAYDNVPVPTQPRGSGGWMCGHHTMLIAWILAMGLSPNHTKPTAEFDEEFYDELCSLIRAAPAGLLDWKTLVAWFFCNKLTTGTTAHLVHQNRRFETTRR
jgi:hypothetical protein